MVDLPQLTKSVVSPDKFSKMNVHDAKVPYTEDTIVCQMSLLRAWLGLPDSHFDEIKDDSKRSRNNCFSFTRIIVSVV